jgi:hypothetical protein
VQDEQSLSEFEQAASQASADTVPTGVPTGGVITTANGQIVPTTTANTPTTIPTQSISTSEPQAKSAANMISADKFALFIALSAQMALTGTQVLTTCILVVDHIEA